MPINDPYYFVRDTQALNAQQRALGQAKGLTPDTVSAMIGANFQAQQQAALQQESIGLQKGDLALRQKAEGFNETATTRGQDLQHEVSMASAAIGAGANANQARALQLNAAAEERRSAQQERQNIMSGVTGLTSLALQTPITYAAGKAAGWWGAPAVEGAGSSTAWGTAGSTAPGVINTGNTVGAGLVNTPGIEGAAGSLGSPATAGAGTTAALATGGALALAGAAGAGNYVAREAGGISPDTGAVLGTLNPVVAYNLAATEIANNIFGGSWSSGGFSWGDFNWSW